MMNVDNFLEGLDRAIDGLRSWSKKDPTEYISLACEHSEKVLAMYNGSLVSVIKVNGYLGQYSPQRFGQVRDSWSNFLRGMKGGDKKSAGFDLFWYYEFDPDSNGGGVTGKRDLMIQASERRGLATRDVFEEEVALYSKQCASESQFLFVVTHLDALLKASQADALKERNKTIAAAAHGVDSVSLGVGVKKLEAIHEQHVNNVVLHMTAQEDMRYSIRRLTASEALFEMRYSLVPDKTHPDWRAITKWKDMRPRDTANVSLKAKAAQSASGRPQDWSVVLPPKLSHQVMPDALDLGDYAVIGERVYAPMYVKHLAMRPEPLEKLLSICYMRRLPIRIAYSLTSNSDQANQWDKLFASIFSFASVSNKQINRANKALKAYEARGGALFGYGVAVATWAPLKVTYDHQGNPTYDVELLRDRARDCETLLQQWGGQQVESLHGCSIEATLSATPGYVLPPVCSKSPQTELDIITQLPLMRPAAQWPLELSMWSRTGDGILVGYQPMSKRQNTMITLISGGMGFGKSNSIADHITFFANHPYASTMPYIRVIDFGESSRGAVDMIRDSLPDDRKHEAIFNTYVNDSSMVKNPMDTRLACRYPLEDHLQYMITFLTTICDNLLEEADMANVVNILMAAIQRAYEEKDPQNKRSSPTPFNPYDCDPVVAAALDRAQVDLPNDPYYWDVVDLLVEHGLRHKDESLMYAARVAQRRAMPLVSDLIGVFSSLQDQFSKLHYKNTTLVEAISATVQSAVGIFASLQGYTNIDISESRVAVFDMGMVFQRGESSFDFWKRSVYFSIVVRLLTEDLFVNKKISGQELLHNQRRLGLTDAVLDYHLRYLEQQDLIEKVLIGDEVHRLGAVKGALQLLDSLGFEGRKYGVGLILGTQVPSHFPKELRKLRTTYLAYGCNQDEIMAKDLQEILDLTDDEAASIKGITKPNPTKGAVYFAQFRTEEGVQNLLLHSIMGGMKRWAYATEADERQLRGILTAEGPSPEWARRTLAREVPDLRAKIKSVLAKHANSETLDSKAAIRHIAGTLLSQA